MRTLELLAVSFALGILALPVMDVSPVGGQGAVNWREADSIPVGQNFVLVEIGSSRRVRVSTKTKDGQPLNSPDMVPTALTSWTQSVRAELALPAHLGYEFENSIGLQPALKGTDSGFVITVGDSAGNARAMFASRGETESLVVALARAADRVPVLSDENLAGVGRLAPDPGLVECAKVRDSVLFSVPPDRWPGARTTRASTYPKAPVDAKVGVPIRASITVLPDGSLDSGSFKVTGTTDTQYQKKALEFLSRQKWIPAKIDGCSVVSVAGVIVTSLGIVRPR